jgi:hypothetical protein
MPVTPAFGKPMQEDLEIKVSLGYIERIVSKNQGLGICLRDKAFA